MKLNKEELLKRLADMTALSNKFIEDHKKFRRYISTIFSDTGVVKEAMLDSDISKADGTNMLALVAVEEEIR